MIIAYILVAVFVLLDQISKLIVENTMTLYEQVIFIKPILNFRFTYNTGAAWSILAEHTWILAIISIICSAGLLYLIKFCNFKKYKLYSIAMSLVAGGAIGNGIDRVFRKKGVVDFLEFGFMKFPIFNVADTFLTIGVILLMIDILFISKGEALPFVKKEPKKEVEENTDGLS